MYVFFCCGGGGVFFCFLFVVVFSFFFPGGEIKEFLAGQKLFHLDYSVCAQCLLNQIRDWFWRAFAIETD